MGSSDPLPAGFEIRFGSLNFQATGNGYLMRITNPDELVCGGRPGPAQSPSHPLLAPRCPPRWMLRAFQHLDAVDALASALGRRRRSANALRASPHSATGSLARRQPLRWGER
jgi:hypothetical protein